MKIVGRFIVLIFVAFAMIFSLIFCFDSSDALTNIGLIGGWILFWGIVLYGLKKIRIL
jgi:hypothetical protein